jgi:hypothetical protein
MLVNPESENTEIYSTEEKNELLYHLFKLFAVGGSMCQPQDQIERYLEVTKEFYKDLVTVYRDSKSGEVKISGKVFQLNSIAGVDMYVETDSPHNLIYIVVEPLGKTITVLKKDFKSFWS